MISTVEQIDKKHVKGSRHPYAIPYNTLYMAGMAHNSTVSQPETVVLSKRFLATREPSKISLIAWLCFVPLAIMYRRIKSCWC
jgi:hypothetical protein